MNHFHSAIGNALSIVWRIANYGLLFITGIILLVIIVIPLCLKALGYRVDEPGWYTANIAWEKRDVRLCDNIIAYNILGPPTNERIALCIQKYAEKSKDPSVCASLLLTRHALECVGAAMHDVRPCPLGADRSVSGNGIDATLTECVHGPATIRNNACCTVSKARFLKSFNDCTGVSGSPAISDQCYSGLSFKNHDASSCEKISNPTIKAGCIINAEALTQDPSICSGCTPALESIEDL